MSLKILLDTPIILQAAADSDRLSAKARRLLLDEENELYFSAASIWEISVLGSLNKAALAADPRLLRRGLLDSGYKEVPISAAHAAAVAQLPELHKDPFDRLLIAQALQEGLELMSADPDILAYKEPVIAV